MVNLAALNFSCKVIIAKVYETAMENVCVLFNVVKVFATLQLSYRLAFQALQNLMLESDEWKEHVVRGKCWYLIFLSQSVK